MVYTAATAQAFGLRVAVVTSAHPNEPLLETFRQVIKRSVVIEAEQTTVFKNLDDPHRTERYVYGRAVDLKLDCIPPAWRSARNVLIAPVINEVPPEIVFDFPNANVYLAPQGLFRKIGKDGRVSFKRWFDADVIAQTRCVVFSEEDIRGYPRLEEKMAAVAPLLIVTRSDKGGTYYVNQQKYTYSADQVNVTQLTGAGDVFASSLLSTLYSTELDIHQCIRVAAKLASASITRSYMHSIPTPDEIFFTINKIDEQDDR